MNMVLMYQGQRRKENIPINDWWECDLFFFDFLLHFLFVYIVWYMVLFLLKQTTIHKRKKSKSAEKADIDLEKTSDS